MGLMCGMQGSLHQFVYFGIAFKHLYQVSFLIVDGQQGRKLDPVERSKKVFNVSADMHIGIFMQVKLPAKLPDL